MSNGVPAGWYHAQGDPEGTVRQWSGTEWIGGPRQAPGAPSASASAPPAPMVGGANPEIGGRELADPGIRLAAAVIDGIVATLLILPLVGPTIVDAISAGEPTIEIDAAPTIIASAITALYYYLPLSVRSATLGKLLVGIRVVKIEGGTEPLGFSTGALRTLNRLVPAAFSLSVLVSSTLQTTLSGLFQAVIAIVGIVSLVLLFSDDNNQTVMDKVAKTVVVKKLR